MSAEDPLYKYCKEGIKFFIHMPNNGMITLEGNGVLSGEKLGIHTLSDRDQRQETREQIGKCNACASKGGPQNCIFKLD